MMCWQNSKGGEQDLWSEAAPGTCPARDEICRGNGRRASRRVELHSSSSSQSSPIEQPAMATAPLRWPLGCLKANLRCSGRQRLAGRFLSTTSAASSEQTSSLPPTSQPNHTLCTSSQQPPPTSPVAVERRLTTDTVTIPLKKTITRGAPGSGPIKSAYAVYEPPAALAQRPPRDPVARHTAAQIARLDPTGARTALFARRRDAAQPGDVLQVTTRRAAEPFAGVCVAVRRRGADTAVLLRGRLARLGVEVWFKIYSRNVVAVDVVRRRARRARRARLTYLRKPEHDVGSVDHLVAAWRKTRNVLSTRGGGPGGGGAGGAAGGAKRGKAKQAAKRK